MRNKYNSFRDSDELIITSGAQQVAELTTKALCNEGDTVICESPSFVGVLNAIRSFGVNLCGIPLDQDGMNLEKLEKALKEEKNVRFIYIIPNFQNPSGITTSWKKRKAIYELAKDVYKRQGKSNISDAMRWVLGEQSTKSLRGSKMEDVIFVGASSRRAQGYAEVSLTLDNTDRAVNFDSDEICVTRRYYRSGESEYRINKAVVRLRDIHEMFMDTGLGRDGYSIISQGKIADIVASKSNDRREIFEEAAGISKYRYRKTDAEKRLSDAQENMLRLKDILKELESQVEPCLLYTSAAKRHGTPQIMG